MWWHNRLRTGPLCWYTRGKGTLERKNNTDPAALPPAFNLPCAPVFRKPHICQGCACGNPLPLRAHRPQWWFNAADANISHAFGIFMALDVGALHLRFRRRLTRALGSSQHAKFEVTLYNFRRQQKPAFRSRACAARQMVRDQDRPVSRQTHPFARFSTQPMLWRNARVTKRPREKGRTSKSTPGPAPSSASMGHGQDYLWNLQPMPLQQRSQKNLWALAAIADVERHRPCPWSAYVRCHELFTWRSRRH